MFALQTRVMTKINAQRGRVQAGWTEKIKRLQVRVKRSQTERRRGGEEVVSACKPAAE